MEAIQIQLDCRRKDAARSESGLDMNDMPVGVRVWMYFRTPNVTGPAYPGGVWPQQVAVVESWERSQHGVENSCAAQSYYKQYQDISVLPRFRGAG